MKKYNCQGPVFQEFTIDSELYHSLPKNHLIRTLMEEHQVILNFCKVLKKLVNKLDKIDNMDEAKDIINDLQYVSGHLLRTERHHIREEHTFIRRLVSMAQFEPSLEIRRQHDELGVQKRMLERTIYSVYTTSFEEFNKEMKMASKKLIRTLKNHIKIEDNELYPQAIEMIPDKARWDKMLEESENIGYCCFTPNKS